MRYFLYFMLLLFFSCKTTNNFYQGRVIDEQNKAIEFVIVAEESGNRNTKTDKNGYFKLDRNRNVLEDLIFSKSGYVTDTIPTVWHQSGETTEYNFIEKETSVVRLKAAKIYEKLDLTTTLPKSENRKIPKTWESLNAIQKDWIEVKKDEKGYLIYEPCDGVTRRITLKDGNLYIQFQMEQAYKFYIDKFTRIIGNESFSLDAYEESTQTGFRVSAKIIDADNGLVLWQFNKEKWLMTPIENAANFRKIKNNCPNEKRGELHFEQPLEE
ncbi:carboxypeptidase-like regulatory domain-containing protein [Pedobacter lithocola]|uniref:Carboxypeptidase-like regulatory domain-containing protein n=1 Tax=Pedobacter lithocola TaxID=1908239 RepID=A0ABV8PCC7_9SPHI